MPTAQNRHTLTMVTPRTHISPTPPMSIMTCNTRKTRVRITERRTPLTRVFTYQSYFEIGKDTPDRANMHVGVIRVQDGDRRRGLCETIG